MSSGFKSILRDKGLVLIPKKAYYPNSPTKYEKDKARMKNFWYMKKCFNIKN